MSTITYVYYIDLYSKHHLPTDAYGLIQMNKRLNCANYSIYGKFWATTYTMSMFSCYGAHSDTPLFVPTVILQSYQTWMRNIPNNIYLLRQCKQFAEISSVTPTPSSKSTNRLSKGIIIVIIELTSTLQHTHRNGLHPITSLLATCLPLKPHQQQQQQQHGQHTFTWANKHNVT